MDIFEKIQHELASFERRRFEAEAGQRAAVLIGLRKYNGEPHFVLTRRTDTVATHKGQISFPGGTWEKGDSTLVETALRETREEIGVAPERSAVLGQFHDYLAVTDFVVRTVVAPFPEKVRFVPCSDEVAYILEVPVGFFQSTEPLMRRRLYRGRKHNVYYYDYGGETIWGLTARMIKDFVAEMLT